MAETMTGKIDKETGLTAQRVLFCQKYVANGFNGTRAAVDAGYSKDRAEQEASRLVSIGKVTEYIDELCADAVAEAKLTAEWLIRKTVENLESAETDKKYSDVNKSAELLGKYLAIWTDKSESNVNVSGVIFNRKPTEPDKDQ